MKGITILFVIIFFGLSASSQQLLWQRGTSNAAAFCSLPNGGYASLNTSLNGPGQFISVSGYDSEGYLIWETPMPSNHHTNYFAKKNLIKYVTGGILVGLRNRLPDSSHFVLMKLNLQGSILWSKKIVATGINGYGMFDLHVLSANKYMLWSIKEDTIGPGVSQTTICVDSSGNTEWVKSYPIFGAPSDLFKIGQNQYLATGAKSVSNALFPSIIKIDSVGNEIQTVIFQNTPQPDYYSTEYGNFCALSDGNIAFTGYNDNREAWGYDRFILVTKTDSALNPIWTTTFSAPGGYLRCSNVHELANGNIILITHQYLLGPTNVNRFILVKINPSGQILDTTYIPGGGQDFRTSILHNDGSLFVGGPDYLAKISGVGIPANVNGNPQQIFGVRSLGLAFPNPAENTVTLPYSIPIGTKSAFIQISGLSTGRVLRQIALNTEIEKVEVDLQNFRSGLYSYTLFIDSAPVATKKLAVFK